jgi:hypothetical protein
MIKKKEGGEGITVFILQLKEEGEGCVTIV